MRALIAIASAGIALFAAATASAATGSDAVGRWTTPSSVDTSSREVVVAPSGAIGRFGAIGRYGAVGRRGVIRLNAAGFRW